MSRYIDREDLLNDLFSERPKDWVGYIAKYPTADAVEVVRCKDCKYYYNGRTQCEIHDGIGYKPTDYCSYGERREDD